jgi:hypothetical protein
MTTWLRAILIGLVIGYGSIFLRDLGIFCAVVVTFGLLVVYARQNRYRDIGLLLVAEGLAPAFIAGWGLWSQVTRADTQVSADTWIFLAAGLLLIASGIVIAASTRQS